MRRLSLSRKITFCEPLIEHQQHSLPRFWRSLGLLPFPQQNRDKIPSKNTAGAHTWALKVFAGVVEIYTGCLPI